MVPGVRHSTVYVSAAFGLIGTRIFLDEGEDEPRDPREPAPDEPDPGEEPEAA
ncbi:MAG TPA: hypothetical protein VFA01_00895 [Candidatus Dormibacteraeota bacterium]|nr:hypothetical protein [Candidatus Dormibacteraeota bacterium]